jgi:NAD(P)-dependent dehydrogenase (short-subunit alcohol dehydrogenase family)
VIPQMRRQRYGRIVNMGSLVGKNGGNARPWLDRAEQRGTATSRTACRRPACTR